MDDVFDGIKVLLLIWICLALASIIQEVQAIATALGG